jgi:hypothetical protein
MSAKALNPRWIADAGAGGSSSPRGRRRSSAVLVILLFKPRPFGTFRVTRAETQRFFRLTVCALSVGSAVFLILEMDGPFDACSGVRRSAALRARTSTNNRGAKWVQIWQCTESAEISMRRQDSRAQVPKTVRFYGDVIRRMDARTLSKPCVAGSVLPGHQKSTGSVEWAPPGGNCRACCLLLSLLIASSARPSR